MAPEGAERIVGLMRRHFPGAMVTANLADFPPKTAANQVCGYRGEPTSVGGLMVALARSGAPGFADEIRRHLP